jgi:hypothetical protein
MSDVAKNNPEMERLWKEAFDLDLVGMDTDYVLQRDERGIIRIARRTMKSPLVEYVGGDSEAER